MDREPCPFRIVDDAGGAFGFGKIEVLNRISRELSVLSINRRQPCLNYQRRRRLWSGENAVLSY